MNLETTEAITLEGTELTFSRGTADANPAIPEPAATRDVPEASTWILLLVATALWLLRLRARQSRTSDRG